MNGGSTVSAVVVSYNTRDLLRDCVESLIVAQRAGEIDEIVVVDSGSSDGSAGMARSLVGERHVVEVENRGYGAAVNTGTELTTGRYVLVLNADTTVPAGTIRELADHLDTHEWCAVAGPRLRYPDGRTQPTRRRFPARLTPLLESTIVEEWWPGNRWARRYRMHDVPCAGCQQVDWLVGAALLLRRSAIEQVGGFDSAFRMYSEEVDLCWRLRQRGWRVSYVPHVDIIHHEGASTGQNIPARQFDFDVSKVRLAERMYGRRYATLIRSGLLAGYALNLIRESSKWVLGHRRDLRRQRVTLYARLLTSRLSLPQERHAR